MITYFKKVDVFSEPLLEFRYSQKLPDPRDGLSMFGPFDTDLPSHPAAISLALVATEAGLQKFNDFSNVMNKKIGTVEEKDRRLWPIFPGFEAAFHCKWPKRETKRYILDETKLLDYVSNQDPNKRAWDVNNYYLEGIRTVLEGDEKIDVVLCLVPEIVYKNCRPESRLITGIGERVGARDRKFRATGQFELFSSFDIYAYQYSVDFRRQIKARAMQYESPIQILRESTLVLDKNNEERGLTSLEDRAWNISTALYYKAGGKPWKLPSARNGVCYIGLAYRLAGKGPNSQSACCAAQMFLDSGDGIVFMGDRGKFYSPQRHEFHLSYDLAYKLLSGVLKTYNTLEGKPLTEIFLHSRSSFDEEEYNGFKSACPENVKLVCIRVRLERSIGTRLFREGDMPVLRGTFWQLDKNSCFLWTSGFKPRLGTYDGWEIPLPIKIDIQRGESDITQVAQDILGLTKLNYNACRLGESEPVTVGFSNAVGEILISNTGSTQVKNKFKFYI